MQALYVQRPAASGGGADPALELTVANHGVRISAPVQRRAYLFQEG